MNSETTYKSDNDYHKSLQLVQVTIRQQLNKYLMTYMLHDMDLIFYLPAHFQLTCSNQQLVLTTKLT